MMREGGACGLVAVCLGVLSLLIVSGIPSAASQSLDATTAPAPASDVPADIKQRGLFRAAFVRSVPWGFRNKHGVYVGFEIDVAKRLARNMGVKHIAVPTTFGSIIPALVARRFDAIVSSMAVTPPTERRRRYSPNPTCPKVPLERALSPAARSSDVSPILSRSIGRRS